MGGYRKGILSSTTKHDVTMKDVIRSQQRSASTPPATFTNEDNQWKKRVVYTDGVLVAMVGIPAAHAKGVPDDAQKQFVWQRKQGLHAISVFNHEENGEYFVHVSNGGRDYVSETFTDIVDVKKHVSKLKESV